MASLSFLVLVLLAGMAISELRGLSARVSRLEPDLRKSPHLSLCPSCP